MDLEQHYRRSLDRQWCMRFDTRHPDGSKYDGVITHIRPEYIILREVRDLDFDGIIVLPRTGIGGVRDGENEKCTNAILRHCGAIRRLRTPQWLDQCATIQGLLSRLRAEDVWPGVETLFDGGKTSAFYLGPIVEIGDREFQLHCYDAAGQWEQIYRISLAEICRIEFDSRYCNRFNAWMRRDESIAGSST
jgi:hypothetical protein